MFRWNAPKSNQQGQGRQHSKRESPRVSLDRALLRVRKGARWGHMFPCTIIPYATLCMYARGVMLHWVYAASSLAIRLTLPRLCYRQLPHFFFAGSGCVFSCGSCPYRSGIRDTRSLRECCKELFMRWVNFRSVFSGPRWRSRRRPLRIGKPGSRLVRGGLLSLHG